MATDNDHGDHRINVHGATLTRRQFVKTGGALIVGASLAGRSLWDKTAEAAAGKNSLDATLANSWFEIHADNTILIRTGKVDFGQSTAHTAYKQIVAEELSVPFEAITTVVMGDTDRTPDGGFSAGFLEYGGLNLRKAAAYTHHALLDLAATTLHVEKRQLSVKDGVVSGGGKRISYGELVAGQGNLAGVVASSEWEAINASQQIAADTKWTEWKGLPGHAQLHTWLRQQADWKTTPVAKSDKDRGDAASALKAAAKSFSASYELPYMKHAPIGPTIAVRDVRHDGTVYVH